MADIYLEELENTKNNFNMDIPKLKKKIAKSLRYLRSMNNATIDLDEVLERLGIMYSYDYFQHDEIVYYIATTVSLEKCDIVMEEIHDYLALEEKEIDESVFVESLFEKYYKE